MQGTKSSNRGVAMRNKLSKMTSLTSRGPKTFDKSVSGNKEKNEGGDVGHVQEAEDNGSLA